MLEFDKNLFTQRFLEKYPRYPENIVTTIMENLEKFDSRLQSVLDAYLKDGTIIDFKFEGIGISIKEIMDKRYCDFFSALTKMEGLLENPESVKMFMEVNFDFIDD